MAKQIKVFTRVLASIYRRLYFAEKLRQFSLLGSLGDSTFIAPTVVIWPENCVHIGNRVQINGFTFIYGRGGVYIGDNVMIGANCVITSVSHSVELESRARSLYSEVRIEAGSWIGAGSIILPGITIGSNSVIGAGSVVTKNIPPGVCAFGAPAVVRRSILE